ncbi:MAG: 30S ribosomal protein S7 [bacterium]|nr:30S ribosomal protein S7 [bacterium]
MRRKVKNRNMPGKDIVYQSEAIGKFINYIMKEGKKNTARRVVYDAFDVIKEKGKTENPLEIFETAIRNVSPNMEVRSRRVGGANYQVPREVRPERKQALAFRWIVGAAAGKKGKPMHIKLADELLSASKNEGEAIKKRENTHRMAEANKAFAHFAW